MYCYRYQEWQSGRGSFLFFFAFYSIRCFFVSQPLAFSILGTNLVQRSICLINFNQIRLITYETFPTMRFCFYQGAEVVTRAINRTNAKLHLYMCTKTGEKWHEHRTKLSLPPPHTHTPNLVVFRLKGHNFLQQ